MIHKVVEKEKKATRKIASEARSTAKSVYTAATLAKNISDKSLRDAKDAARAHRIALRKRLYE